MGCARTGWTRARQRPQWAVRAATALAVGCCGGGRHCWVRARGTQTCGRAQVDKLRERMQGARALEG